MSNRGGFLARNALGIFLVSVCAYAQATGGRLSGTISDPQGAKVPGASVVVLNPLTGQMIETVANERGDYVIPGLAPATYRVTVSLAGFKTAVFQDVKIDTDVPVTLNVTLGLGALTETVEVAATAEILQTNSATVSSTLVGRQIYELPFTSRNVLELIVTQVGTQTVGTPRTSSINGLPKGSMNITMDGINIQDNLLRSDDGFFATIQPRTDSIEEVSVSTAGLGANNSGEGAAQVKFITKRGTNDFHGGLFWQHRNTALNANYYFNNRNGLPRDQMILNQGGVHLGGPFVRNRAFFFVNWEGFWLPQSYNVSARILTPEAAQGIFRYRDGTQIRSVNLFDLARAKNPTLPANVRQFPTTSDPTIQAIVNEYLRLATSQTGSVRERIETNSDYNRNDFTFQAPGTNRRKFYTARFDYNLTSKHSANIVWNYQNYYANPDGVNSIFPVLPGTGTVLGHPESGGTRRISYGVVGALNSILTPRLTSEIRFGVAPAGISIFREEITPKLFEQWRGYGINFNDTGNNIGWIQSPHRGNSPSQSRRHTPATTLSADLTWARNSHLWSFGANLSSIKSWQETLGSSSFPIAQFSMTTNDPANTGNTSLFDTTNFSNSTVAIRNDAATLYAILSGRVSQFTRSVGLDETGHYTHTGSIDRNRQREFALFVQDSWKMLPSLTVNYGTRWDVQLPFYNVRGTYTRVGDGVWGISGVGNLFSPGVLAGVTPEFTPAKPGQYAYKTNWKNFSPSLGFAWAMPKVNAPLLSWMFGKDGTVFRGGYSIATVREGMNIPISIWGSNQGRTVASTVNPGNFPGVFGPAGSVWFRDESLPTRPEPDRPTYPIPVVAGNSVNEFDPNLRMGYVQSWNVSLQRQITPSTVLDIRYVGNHGTTLWRQININEVNIFENGFLEEFKVAQQNLALAQRSNPMSTQFAGLAGQQPLPIITTATGLNSDTTFANYLVRGQAGQFATDIANNQTRMANLTRAGYPANLFRVNPTVGSSGAFLVTNGGHSTYNALQLELRRRLSNGLLAQGSYVWSKSLTNMLASSSSVTSQPTTLRDTNFDKGASPWDVRHGFKLNFVYELPFGPGRRFYTQGLNPILQKIAEGWEIAGVTRVQSGTPELLNGRATFNNITAGQVVLNNLTTKELQNMVKIRKTTAADGLGVVYFLPQDLIDNTLAAFEIQPKTLAQLDRSKPYIGPQTEPGKLGYRVFYYGPWQQRWDLSVVKKMRIGEAKSMEFRTQFLNAFNNINFLIGSAANEVNTQPINSEFGQVVDAYRDISVSGTNDPGGRVIEFMLRIVF
jgi:Carboxypeptidase regulatory-like domain